MHLKGPSVTSILRGLEEKGYIIRTTRKDDARAMVLTVTDKGERLVKEVRSVFSNVEQALQCGLTQEEKDMLMNLLAKVCRNLPEESKR
ncbi:DNA-binding MarR family transcriptional regulator [Clostridioides mangenotii]|uniref:DNA-binding MarR family transcriptional regulator n=2 Tax=Metaclostridioides mangenotii TaxID=1540 RepID=A0ABS4EEJ4_9FIRM|nr:DNA-binding MarR family transcriptional regulator [Clostridioides mangenotii]